MAKRMLIDAAHPEETRVVVTNGTRLEEFDVESSTKKQVKGNIYLAKVTRVEPSLQAAFVDYGGNRHGFLAFSEIHPDYYRIPVGDRRSEGENGASNGHYANDSQDEDAVPIASALPEQVAVPEMSGSDEDEAEEPRSNETADGDTTLPNWPEIVEPEGEAGSEAHAEWPDHGAATEEAAPPVEIEAQPEAAVTEPEAVATEPETAVPEIVPAHDGSPVETPVAATDDPPPVAPLETISPTETMALRSTDDSVIAVEISEYATAETDRGDGEPAPENEYSTNEHGDDRGESEHGANEYGAGEYNRSEYEADERAEHSHADSENHKHHEGEHGESVETLGGDEVEEAEDDDAAVRRRYHSSRHYKIQEVIKRRQIMLVQVAKEERGNKGAALTTYLSLAGRYCVLMPNTNRGGGVSRKITSIADRRRLKDILEDLEIPEGMGVIVRTAGAERSKAEIKRDYEYLLRLWNEIRDLTLQSTAPALIYEEGNLIKRSIRDLYTRDIEDVLVEGEEGYKIAKSFMRTLMPSHAKRVQPYRDPQVGLFHRFQIESQIDAVHSPVAQLKSGGYLVINQTEALVSIDVNSGRSTRERNIEETALRTNLEASDEIGRQLRLRDLAGLIVIDFIDMEEHRNQNAVERRLKEALRNDRARIQVGRISPFGLMEMSRQRLRPSLTEASTLPCPHCGGTGFIRSVESTALYVLRAIEEEGGRRRSAEICVFVPTNVALYILNHKRDSLVQIELRYAMRVKIERDDTLIPPNYRLERLRQYGIGEAPPLPTIQAPSFPEEPEDDDEDETIEAADETVESTSAGESGESEEDRSRRRRRRRRRRPDEGREPREARPNGAAHDVDGLGEQPDVPEQAAAEGEAPAREGDGERRHRRRSRRGRIRTPRRDDASAEDGAEMGAEGYAGAEMSEGAEMLELSPEPPSTEPYVASEHEAYTPQWEPAPPSSFGGEAAFSPASPEPVAPVPVAVDTVEPLPVPPEPEPIQVPYEPAPVFAAAPEPIPEPVLPTAEAEQGIPFVSEPERVLEEAAASPAPVIAEPAPVLLEPVVRESAAPEPVVPEPVVREPVVLEPVAHAAAPEPASRLNDDVLTVTEKPANPRRGWWQRLINS